MTNLKEAWDAIRQGDRLKAQEIAAQILKNDPRNAEGWMVLGEAVSGERQALFYRKALQLDPELDGAKERLLEIEQNHKLGISTNLPSAEPLPMMTGQPEIPDGVELDAPTVPLVERIAAQKAKPKTQSTAAMEARAKTAQSSTAQPVATATQDTQNEERSGFDTNTILLVLIIVAIVVVLFFMFQNFPTLS